MNTDENKYYILKVKYSVQEISGKKKNGKKSIHKRKKRYLVKNLNTLDSKFQDIEDALTEMDTATSKNIFSLFRDYVVRFGSNCNSTYHRMLRI